MHTLFFLWLGGLAGQATILLTNPDATRGGMTMLKKQLRRYPHKRATIYTASLAGMLLQMMIWPISLVTTPILLRWLRVRRATNGTGLTPMACACCGDKEDACVLGEKWVSLAPQWYFNEHHEVVCSPACAAHLDDAHHERHLH